MVMSQVKPRSAFLRNGMLGTVLGTALLQPAAAIELKNPFGAPKVEVDVIHQPAIPIKATTLAMGPPEGKCSEALATRLEEAIIASRTTTLVDRQRFMDVMKEHRMQINITFNRTTAARIGELVGAQALVFLKVESCKTHQEKRELGYAEDLLTANPDLVLRKEQEKKDLAKQGNGQQQAQGQAYAFVNNGIVGGTMRVVDLATGRVLAAQRFEGTAAVSDRTGFVADERLIDAAEQDAAAKLVRMIVPWKEAKTMVFFDDETCDLRTANRMLSTKDVEGATQKSIENLDACKTLPKVKPKVLARAYYNLGVMQYINSHYDMALENLAAADRTDNEKVFIAVSLDVRKDKLAYEEVQKSIAGGSKEKPQGGGPIIKQQVRLATQPGSAAAPSVAQRLSELKALLDQKVISQQEHDKRRDEILKGI